MKDYLEKPPLLIAQVEKSLTSERRANAQKVVDFFNKNGSNLSKVRKCPKIKKS